jgi:predicted dehydrogenase
MWAPKLAAAAQRAGLEIVTCHSRSEEKRAAFAERVGCAAAATLEEAIGHPDVEGVVLATPNDTHEEQTLACVAQGRHVFVEKPIADSSGRASACVPPAPRRASCSWSGTRSGGSAPRAARAS